MSPSPPEHPQATRPPLVVGAIALLIYLAFIASSFFWTGGWIGQKFQNHYIFFVGLPFAGFLAYFIVGTLESVRGKIEFQALGVTFKGASGPIIMWVLVFLSIVVAIRLVWDLG